MKMSLLLFLMMNVFISTSAAQVSLTLARELWLNMEADKCNALKLSKLFDNSQPKDALLKAYWGASTAAAPECLGNPLEKIKYFRKGKSLLDESVEQQPEHVEIRFLRFATQTRAPSFLGYNDKIQEDKNLIMKNISHYAQTSANEKMASHIAGFLILYGELSATEKSNLKQFLSK